MKLAKMKSSIILLVNYVTELNYMMKFIKELHKINHSQKRRLDIYLNKF